MEYISIGVVIMKRKALIILVIITSGFFIFILSSDKTQTTHYRDTTVIEENKEETEPESSVTKNKNESTGEDSEEEMKQKENPESKVSNIIVEVVQNTIDFFSEKDLNIVAVGDSLTQGVGDSQNQGGYVGIIDRTINKDTKHANIQNFGKRGDRTDQLLLRLNDHKVATSVSEADIILITIGANDIMQVVKENFTQLTYGKFADARSDYEKRLRAVFERIQSLNDEAKIYLIGFYNPFAKYFPEIEELGMIVDDWNEVGEKMTGEYSNTTYIPTKDLFADEDIDLFAEDHFHPNDRGYERMAKRVLNYITEETEG